MTDSLWYRLIVDNKLMEHPLLLQTRLEEEDNEEEWGGHDLTTTMTTDSKASLTSTIEERKVPYRPRR